MAGFWTIKYRLKFLVWFLGKLLFFLNVKRGKKKGKIGVWEGRREKEQTEGRKEREGEINSERE